MAALSNGYPVTICTGQGFVLTRDADGFCSPKGTWGHCMLIGGVRFDRPGACILQSWGRDVPDGPDQLSASRAGRSGPKRRSSSRSSPKAIAGHCPKPRASSNAIYPQPGSTTRQPEGWIKCVGSSVEADDGSREAPPQRASRRPAGAPAERQGSSSTLGSWPPTLLLLWYRLRKEWTT